MWFFCLFTNIDVLFYQAQSDDDEGGDDVAVNVDGGFMEEFFEQVSL